MQADVSGSSSLIRSLLGELFAHAAAGRLETIYLRIMLSAEAAVAGLSVLFFTGTVVESRMGINPDANGRVSLKVNHGRWCFGDSHGDEEPFHGAERGAPGRAYRWPQKSYDGQDHSRSKIEVGAMKAQCDAYIRQSQLGLGGGMSLTGSVVGGLIASA